ncbi:LCP family protein [Pontibacillus sp. HMF3514]|uniref:LCP family protein n=1 Tax=Pontibacillus sp. HMF3514 TaxID=2692425 RepID=UPI001320201A|nr:LCP family protein [Pontibacillus sp. HMF3514]QHE53607.1 LytR family transcriptional regulator [Pontibacillus sp. HMF3514]
MKTKKASKKRIILWSFLVLFLLAAGATAGYGMYLTNKAKTVTDQAQQELNRGDKSTKRDEVVDPNYDNISILFLGIDDSDVRNIENARSDAMVLATLNEKEKSIKLVSIPRDSYVDIPSKGFKDKITHAHAFGGVDLAVSTVENMFNIPVDYYVRLNFNAFIETVNALGGIEYDVPFKLSEKNSNDVAGAIKLEKGQQHLNGEEALALARSRQYDSDMARGQRQMELMKAIFQEASKMKSIGKYGSLIDSIGKNMKTNMEFEEMVSLHDYALRKNNVEIDTMQLNGNHAYIDDIYYYRLKDQSVTDIMSKLQVHLELENGSNDDSAYAKDDEESIQDKES